MFLDHYYLPWNEAICFSSHSTSSGFPFPFHHHHKSYHLLDCFKVAANICIFSILYWALSQVYTLMINMHYSEILITA